MNNSHKTQIIPGKWKHICINRNREENYNQSLDVEGFFSQMDFDSLSQTLQSLKNLTHKTILFASYTENDSINTKLFS